jgi:hypothetical protein
VRRRRRRNRRSFPTHDEIEFHSLYNAADDVLYRAKAAGRNRVLALETLPSSDHDAATGAAPAFDDAAHTGALP